MTGILSVIAAKLDSCDRAKILSIPQDIQAAIDQGLTPDEIIENGLLEGLNSVGAKFKVGDVFIPEVLVAARAIHQSMETLRPLLKNGKARHRGRIVLGTVKGDLHDIGKNLVGIMLEGAGFEIIDIGINVPPENFIQAAREKEAGIVGLSSLLTTTMNEMQTVIESFKEAGLNTKIIVGGAPVTQEFASKIGADAYAVNAGDAVEKVTALL
jgi:5-methyltetrahydrofolate--homocysteine methyltransferase